MASTVTLMSDANVYALMLIIISGLLTFLTGILSYLGMKVHARLDAISKSLQAIEKDLRSDLGSLDRRVSRTEGRLSALFKEE